MAITGTDPYTELANGNEVTITGEQAQKLLSNARKPIRRGEICTDEEYDLTVTKGASSYFFTISNRYRDESVALGEL